MPDEARLEHDKWQENRTRYNLPDVEGRRMGKYGPITEPGKPEFFSLKTQLVSEGRNLQPIAETDNLWCWVKVYASGGENTLHAHSNEDHMFIVLDGEATFYGPKGEEKVVGKNNGVMLPRGAFYNFCCTSDTPLVLLRVGASAGEGEIRARLGIDGEPLPGSSKKNKFAPPVYAEGKFFE